MLAEQTRFSKKTDEYFMPSRNVIEEPLKRRCGHIFSEAGTESCNILDTKTYGCM